MPRNEAKKRRTHFCGNCKKVQPLAPYTGAKLDKDEQKHVFECGECGHIIDVDDPRNAPPVQRRKGYEVYKRGQEVIVVLNKTTAGLVSSALEIVNPDSANMETRARNLALEIEQAL